MPADGVFAYHMTNSRPSKINPETVAVSDSIQSLIKTGTKLYLDSVEPSEVDQNLAWGAVGATSNPAIISAIVKQGGFDKQLNELLDQGHDDEAIAWSLTNSLVEDAQSKFASIHAKSSGNAGWVSFELDPLLEDPDQAMSDADRTAAYVELGKQWNTDQTNRMIKVPATPAGIAALEDLAAAGVTLNVTLIFTMDQYEQARDAVWRGAQKRDNLDSFKSVYSIFISRIDVYTADELPGLSAEAQGEVGLLNAKRIWKANREFWAAKGLKLEQELIFASTGVKDPAEKPWKYVEALAGSDIQTNPPATNEAVAGSGLTFASKVDELPSDAVQKEIDKNLDLPAMQQQLMDEGVAKFVKPQRALLELIAQKRKEMSVA